MDYVVSVWFQQSELDELLVGLNGLQKEAQHQFGKDFVALDEAEQVQLLAQMEAGGSAVNASAEELLHSKVFGRLKELTVVGYYFTEVGAKQERRYVPMPGRYDGYYKLNKVGRQWSS